MQIKLRPLCCVCIQSNWCCRVCSLSCLVQQSIKLADRGRTRRWDDVAIGHLVVINDGQSNTNTTVAVVSWSRQSPGHVTWPATEDTEVWMSTHVSLYDQLAVGVPRLVDTVRWNTDPCRHTADILTTNMSPLKQINHSGLRSYCLRFNCSTLNHDHSDSSSSYLEKNLYRSKNESDLNENLAI